MGLFSSKIKVKDDDKKKDSSNERSLAKWEKKMTDGRIYTDIHKLPETDKYNWAKDEMIDWVSKRKPQIELNATKEYDKFVGTGGEVGDRIHPIDAVYKYFGGTPRKDFIETRKKEIEDVSIKRLNTVKYKDESRINKTSSVDAVYGSYKPYVHSIAFTIKPDKDVVYHETAHSSRLGSTEGSQIIVGEVKDQSEKYNLWKKNSYNSYLDSTEEINSRIYEIRMNSSLKPEQVISPKDIPLFKKENKGNELFDMFSDDEIAKLLNSLVLNEKKGLFNNNV